MKVKLQDKYDLDPSESWDICSGWQWKQDCGCQGNLWNTPWNIQVASAMLFSWSDSHSCNVFSGCLTQASTRRPLPYVSDSVSRFQIICDPGGDGCCAWLFPYLFDDLSSIGCKSWGPCHHNSGAEERKQCYSAKHPTVKLMEKKYGQMVKKQTNTTVVQTGQKNTF